MGRRWLVQEECKNIKYFQIEWKSQIEDFQHRKDGKHMKWNVNFSQVHATWKGVLVIQGVVHMDEGFDR